MTEEQREWIDNASYLELLRKWRFEPIGSEYFVVIGSYYGEVMAQRKAEIGSGAAVAVSKLLGWERP